MSRQAISAQRHILRALDQWPKDPLRPQVQFQDVLRKRFERPSGLSEQDQLKQANALYSLLHNRYKTMEQSDILRGSDKRARGGANSILLR
ncbi:uncharacterized protein F4812DRAFT_463625 [Daldinia caldariorum]|uniref:uncharacterized protein n=1 Tax=Daldinia caldariorum TaxID=326644 RepID=UPI002008BA2A|nr:uncharacterized protein F4812DRAFT_463625 [Daldinia caldariorum]KAI1463526.1 hypothetical protein F4812DRAFT_463625 [Daldinia caldariorum]